MENFTKIMDYFPYWADYLVAIRQVRPDSINFYRDKIKWFINYSWETEVAILWNLFLFEIAYTRFAKSPLADSTKSKTWATLQEFSDYLVKKQIIQNNAPRLLGTPPKVRRPEIMAFTNEEIHRIKIAIWNRYKDEERERNLLIFELFLYTGIRHNEFRNLKKKDISRDYIHIRAGKWGKSRFVAIPAWFGDKILDFIKYKNHDDFIFANRSDPHSPATHALASKIFSKISDITGLHIHPHKLRHTYATQCLIIGMDPHILQQQLGHEDLKMTMSYVHIIKEIRIQKVQNLIKPNFLCLTI